MMPLRDMMQDHKPSPDALPLAALQLDEAAKGVLMLVRHFLTSFTEAESQAWQMAFATAQERWGVVEGPQVAMLVLTTVQAMRRLRPEPFRFANPLCLECRNWVTPEEAELLSMIQAMRRDRTNAARNHLANVTGGRMEPHLIQAGLQLAKRLGEIAAWHPQLVPQMASGRLH